MQKQRIIDSDHQQIIKEVKKEERKFGGLKSKAKGKPVGQSGGKWMKQSEQFRNAMRAARGAKPLPSMGGGFGGDDSYEPDDGLTPCPT